MILHVLDRAREADIGPIAVACAEHEIAAVVRAEGALAVVTDPALPRARTGCMSRWRNSTRRAGTTW